MPYVLEQAWCVQSPVPNTYTVWWPWIKGYHGEYSPGICNEFRWAKYIWIDQELKKSMGY
jgi:peptide/nickel transport system substrate-binding protein